MIRSGLDSGGHVAALLCPPYVVQTQFDPALLERDIVAVALTFERARLDGVDQSSESLRVDQPRYKAWHNTAVG